MSENNHKSHDFPAMLYAYKIYIEIETIYVVARERILEHKSNSHELCHSLFFRASATETENETVESTCGSSSFQHTKH